MERRYAFFCFVFGTGLVCAARGDVHWTYAGQTMAQAHWSDEYPACAGQAQSPIDIKRRSARYNPSLTPIELSGYDTQTGFFLVSNTGHSVKVALPPGMEVTRGLPARYTAVQMHLHWGDWSDEASGSEHTLDGVRYLAELHVVHYNSDRYSSFAEAKDKPDGLAVLGFFLEGGHFENTYYSDFLSNLANVRNAGDSFNLYNMDLRSMLPESLDRFFQYAGSLTTPPCYQSVLWTMFETPIVLSYTQMRKLQSVLMDPHNLTLTSNYRVVQPLNQRLVQASFLPGSKERFSPSPLVLYFPEDTAGSYAVLHLDPGRPVPPLSLTACMLLRLPPRGVHTALSYASAAHDSELRLTLGGHGAGLWVGDSFLYLPLAGEPPRGWARYCVTWSSRQQGAAALWVDGERRAEGRVAPGYALVPGGVMVLGKDQVGSQGGVVAWEAFEGHMTEVNLWDYALSPEAVRGRGAGEGGGPGRGNVFGWGVDRISLYGGVMLNTAPQ